MLRRITWVWITLLGVCPAALAEPIPEEESDEVGEDWPAPAFDAKPGVEPEASVAVGPPGAEAPEGTQESVDEPGVSVAVDPPGAGAPEGTQESVGEVESRLEISPVLVGEIDYRSYPSETEGYSGFSLGRLRPGLSLSPMPRFLALTTIELAEKEPSIMDAFVRVRPAAWLGVTVGYSKPPLFASFVYEPVHLMPFPDRSPVIKTFGVRRDVGVDVHVEPRSVPLEGWLRVGNGSGSPLGNDNALPAGYALLDLVLGRARGASTPPSPLGLRLGAGGFVESARDRDGLSGATPLGFVYYRPTVVSGLRFVGEGHMIAYAGPLRFTTEAALARESRSRDHDGNPATPRQPLAEVTSYGLTAELAWVVIGEPREVGRPPRASPSGGGWGALEIAARYDGLWLNRGASDVRPGGSQGGVLALKWWALDFFAAALSAYAMRYDTPAIEAPDQYTSFGALARVSYFWGATNQPHILRRTR